MAPPTPAGASSPSSSSTISASTNATLSAPRRARVGSGAEETENVRTGSGFWAAGYDSSHRSRAFSASQLLHLTLLQADDSGDDSDGTEIVTGSSNDGSSAATRAAVVLTRGQQPSQQQQQQRQRTDDAGALDAFVAGMIYALSRRLLPGVPYMPGLAGPVEVQRSEGGRWKLNECLRFVTELAGHKACRRAWDGLGKEMAWAGWFDG
ncbi:hypothetical protein BJV78DRAFT_1246192 [Lactifluus subvellereus]|nr:hypothetical protein BJV78DRAFT_1246192 [Lactifluus subvellereus]